MSGWGPMPELVEFDLAGYIAQLTPEDCPDPDRRMKASEAAADHIEANLATFRGPDMAHAVASAGRAFRNEWYAAQSPR